MTLTLILLPLLLPEAPFSISSANQRRRKRLVWKPSVLETMEYFVDLQEVCVVMINWCVFCCKLSVYIFCFQNFISNCHVSTVCPLQMQEL